MESIQRLFDQRLIDQRLIDQRLIDQRLIDQYVMSVSPKIREMFNTKPDWVFCHAVVEKRYDIAKPLVKKLVDKSNGDWALTHVSTIGELEMVIFFVENGVNVHIGCDGSPLRWACERGHLDVVKYLGSKGAHATAHDNIAIIQAVINGHFEVVKYLVDNLGVNPRANKDWALCLASGTGRLSIVRFLCDRGANVCVDNNLPLKWASDNCHFETVEYLCKRGAQESRITNVRTLNFIMFRKKMESKQKERAQKKIYFWWIPICYDIRRECGKRMQDRNVKAYQEMICC